MKFRFKDFRVYQDAKDYCKFSRDIIKKQVKDRGIKASRTKLGGL
jgi:hypothetical protein